MTGTDDDSMWILGINFFNEYYAVFDKDNLKVGFAPSSVAFDSSVKYVVGEDTDLIQMTAENNSSFFENNII